MVFSRCSRSILAQKTNYLNVIDTVLNLLKPSTIGRSSSTSSAFLSSTANIKGLKPDWNRAVSDAEKIVGYPTSFVSLQSLLNNEIFSSAFHFRKLIGSNHPFLKIVKRLIHDGRNNMQTRGLIVLLVSKLTGQPKQVNPLDQDTTVSSLGVLPSQRSLAELTEMIHTAHLIHKGVVNLKGDDIKDNDSDEEMQYGNKIAILCGDFLLGNACFGLASLRNTYVVEIISGAIRDFMESQFIGVHDPQGLSIPSSSVTIQDWESKNYLMAASLLANSCRSAALLAGHDKTIQDQTFQLGKHIALAWQAHSELQPFVDLTRNPPGTSFDLMSSPVVFHIQSDPSVVESIESHKGSLENFDFKKLHEMLLKGTGIEEAKKLCQGHLEKALTILRNFEESDTRTALENIIKALHV